MGLGKIVKLISKNLTIITIGADGKRKTEYKNAYKDYGVPADEFVDVYTDHLLYKESKPEGVIMP